MQAHYSVRMGSHRRLTMLTVDINKAMLVYCNQSATCDDSAEICNAKIWPANFHFL